MGFPTSHFVVFVWSVSMLNFMLPEGLSQWVGGSFAWPSRTVLDLRSFWRAAVHDSIRRPRPKFALAFRASDGKSHRQVKTSPAVFWNWQVLQIVNMLKTRKMKLSDRYYDILWLVFVYSPSCCCCCWPIGVDLGMVKELKKWPWDFLRAGQTAVIFSSSYYSHPQIDGKGNPS